MHNRPRLFFQRAVAFFGLHEAREDLVRGRRSWQHVRNVRPQFEGGHAAVAVPCILRRDPVRITHEFGPRAGFIPILVQILELIEIDLTNVVQPAPGFAEQRGCASAFVIQPRAKTGMQLVFGGVKDVIIGGFKHAFVGQRVRSRIISIKRDHRARQRFCNNLVFDRAEQHVDDRCHKCDDHKDQQRGNQHQRAQLLGA